MKTDKSRNKIIVKPGKMAERHNSKRSDNTERDKKPKGIYEPIFYGRVLLWFVIQMIYTFLGSLLFVFLEECHGNDEMPNSNYKNLILYIENQRDINEDDKKQMKNITEKYFQTLMKERECELNHDVIAKWWSFTIITCYTIGNMSLFLYYFTYFGKYAVISNTLQHFGYGHVTPRTIHGKAATIIYATIGIPLSIAMYNYAATMVTSAIRNAIKLVENKLFKTKQVNHLNGKTLSISLVLFFLYFFSLVYFNTLDGHGNLSVIDSTYYWFQTLTTIGYGDVYPVTEHNDLTETILRVSYMFGLGMTASLISSTSTFLYQINQRNVNKLVLLSRKRRKSWTPGNQHRMHTFQSKTFMGETDSCR